MIYTLAPWAAYCLLGLVLLVLCGFVGVFATARLNDDLDAIVAATGTAETPAAPCVASQNGPKGIAPDTDA